ncbi:MAG: asparagine synthase (glutamine-hydrolyzing) [Deltaproteobacteria bacterium]|nr:asparagine synthase (glutamine-hydrolyzing) [Deltaproteobacteria bacterium]
MCGVAGFTFDAGLRGMERRGRFERPLQRMLAALRHRGPDAQRGLLLDGMALGHTRLAIVDLEGGVQPMRDPATGVTVTFNGEIFNHQELREPLARGYAFRTRSDTEVLLASYLAYGIDCVQSFNGQFAFAIWDPRTRELWLARDRVGICPLFYARTSAGLAFASEAKALFAAGLVTPRLDVASLKQTLQLWSPAEGRSAFEGVCALPPRTVARFASGALELRRYWELDLDDAHIVRRSAREDELEVEALLRDAVRLRLRADVPVGAYLSGGLDSSLLSAIAKLQIGDGLKTFSVKFRNGDFDEREHQARAVAALRTEHATVEVDERAVAEALPEVVWHAEQLLLRAAPAPLLKLSNLVREHGLKVVLTGEGADEIFWGYDLYKETSVRQRWAQEPDSPRWSSLLSRLYPWLGTFARASGMLRESFGVGLDAPDAWDFSHRVRWTAGARLMRLLEPGVAFAAADEDPASSAELAFPTRALGFRALARAQVLEMQTFLSGYLLSAQGDRVLLGHGVEGRFPFLDHRLMQCAARLPDTAKLRGLRDKRILRRIGRRLLPPVLAQRGKFPYRAPVVSGLVGPNAVDWAREALQPSAIRQAGLFDANKVKLLVDKLARGGHASESDASALVAVATGQLLEQMRVAWTRPFRAGPFPAEVEAA